jgi:hypothetical protein
MFFQKRRNALRITERMGLDPRSAETTQLVDMIIAGVKQYNEMLTAAQRGKVSAFERTLWSTAGMTDNVTAYVRLKRELGIGDDQVIELMRRARAAGRELAIEEGLTGVVERFFDRLRPVGEVMGK